MLFDVDILAPHPPLITGELTTGPPQPPRIARRLVRRNFFLDCRVRLLLLRVVEKGFKDEKNLVNPII